MALTRYAFDTTKRYSLEVYASGERDRILWKRDTDHPFAPMGRGDALILPELPDAAFDDRYRIEDVEHVVWLPHQDEVRFVTRVFVVLER